MAKKHTYWFVATGGHDHTNEVIAGICLKFNVPFGDDQIVRKTYRKKEMIVVDVPHKIITVLKKQKESRPPGEIKFKIFFNHDNGEDVAEWKWKEKRVQRTKKFKMAKKDLKRKTKNIPH